MVEDSELSILESDAGDAGPTLVPRGKDGLEQLDLYANILENFLEGYRVLRGTLHAVRGPLTPRDLAKRAITTGERMYLAKESDDAKL